jgi:hypothetical protein
MSISPTRCSEDHRAYLRDVVLGGGDGSSARLSGRDRGDARGDGDGRGGSVRGRGEGCALDSASVGTSLDLSHGSGVLLSELLLSGDVGDNVVGRTDVSGMSGDVSSASGTVVPGVGERRSEQRKQGEESDDLHGVGVGVIDADAVCW